MDEALRKSIEKHNQLQEDANNLMRSLIPALQGLAQEIADWREEMPEVQAIREKRAQAAKDAATGKYATPPPPSR